MYQRFGISGKGYTEEDYRKALHEVSGVSFADVFDHLVYGTSDYTPYLKHVTDALGLDWKSERAVKWSESALGISVDDSGTKTVVSAVIPDSPGDLAGLWNDDEIVTVNGYAPYKNIQQLLRMHSGREIVLGVIRKYIHLQITLRDDSHIWKTRNVLSLKVNRSGDQVGIWKKWAGES
jgi:predicted metalloprotease with PDZ domain